MKRSGLSLYVLALYLGFCVSALLAGCSSSCSKNSDCAAGNVCISGGCFNGSTYDGAFPPYDPGETGCSVDSQCGPCEQCTDGLCKAISGCDSGYFPWPDGGSQAG
jgi:hypothetical protein